VRWWSGASSTGTVTLTAAASSGGIVVDLTKDYPHIGANLSDAYKRAADGSRQTITNEELWQQTNSLNGATMPDGQKYEDWLKSKDRGEEGENSGPS